MAALVVRPKVQQRLVIRFRRFAGGIVAWDEATGSCYLAGDTGNAQEQLLVLLRLRRPTRR